ncbi:MAG: deaminated glutathione amidase [Methylobacteriaceae bacterium]|jgi:predicted amidohydrolase|nr:deaminated glutathione amidase [Methylobacteriaceae bacterium]
MRAALGQIFVSREWTENADTCVSLMREARGNGADLLLVPEGIIARDIREEGIAVRTAQALDGPFMQRIMAESKATGITFMGTIHVPAEPGRVYNVFVAVRGGELIAAYRKLHLYDAFSSLESDTVTPGTEVPPLVEVAGVKIGLMTCYDVRFPELARRLAVDGADVLALPAAWVRGPLKEYHWQTLVTARALDNTCYVLAAGECGPRNIGASMAVDPLGVVFARAGEAPALIYADIDLKRLEHARSVLPVLLNRRFGRPELQ